ncbi:hypothetical protein C0995_012830 [Termitomyces sp. Mi166|nr:hypothetical protein C0995_012830 [Termitomyces sp. Mi166\
MSISSFQDPWFSTKTLPDGQHDVTFENLPGGFVIDYMTITPSNDTFLIGKQLIVDDTDPSLIYSGQWTRNTTTLLINPDFNPESSTYNATSFGGDFLETGDQKASVKFTFTVTSSKNRSSVPGTSVGVYGFYDSKYTPLFSTFDIDGVNQGSNYGFSDYLAQAHYPWFESGPSLSPGSHVLTITFDNPLSISLGPGGRFTLDYIIYTSSFSSLAAQAKSNHSNKRSILIGAIVGSVVGILLVACLVFMLRKKLIARRISANARLAPEPFRNDPNSTAIPPDTQGPHTVPIIESRKGAQLATQGGNTGEGVLDISQR